MSKPKTIKVTEEQVSLILQAIASMESWDGEKNCILMESDGGWAWKRVNGIRTPCPSDRLLDKIKGLTS